MLLVYPNLCAGVVACFLDNTVKGTLKERGIEAWQVMIDDKSDNMKEFDGDVTIYDIPPPRYLKKSNVFRRLPFIPPVRE